MKNFSIIVCTYNPNEKVFTRVLRAISQLEIEPDVVVECVIVDNNSSPSVEELTCVREFLQHVRWAKVIREPKQGLSFARLAGLQASSASVIVFFDDDNEPRSDYLKVVKRCLDDYPNVAVWGPGTVNVEFVDPVSNWFEQNFRSHFGARDCKYIEYGCARATWTHYYPSGTGQVVRRVVLDRYYQEFIKGQLSMTGRQGSSLASAEDVQIVWESIKMGMAAGKFPNLALTHLIPSKRSNLNYVKRHVFGTSSSYIPALVESFPNEVTAKTSIPSGWRVLLQITGIVLLNFLKGRVKFIFIDIAAYLGGLAGRAKSTKSNQYWWLDNLAKFFAIT